jgi:hypothetical protein
MALTKEAFEAAADIQHEFEQNYAKLPLIVGVGLGVNSASTAPAINVQVSGKLEPDALPKTFHGLEVVIDVVGEIQAY